MECLPGSRHRISFDSYAEAQRRVEEAYRHTKKWAKMAILQTAHVGKFSSDRTIEEYVRDIWHLQKVKLPAPRASKKKTEK